jgi:iron(III) transport system ATP-binding protein
MDHLLCIEDLTRTFPGQTRPVIEGVSFCVEPGEVLAIVGPSGCGKTTTLRTIMGFERAERGRVRKQGLLCTDCDAGVHLPPEKRGIGIVFQDYALFPHLSVIRNVMFGVRGPRKLGPASSRRRRKQIAREALWMVGLMDVDDRPVQALSGGQQQRVAIARALAPGAQVLLLDEPFSNLDPDLRQATRAEVRALAERAGLAVVLVTHDQEEALSLADHLLVMRDGVVRQAGKPESVYARPRSAFVARFLGQTNLLPGQANHDVAETPLGRLQLGDAHRGPVLLSLRPEDLALSPVTGNGAGTGTRPVGRIVAREFKGHDLTFRVRVADRELAVQMEAGAAFQVGHHVQLSPLRPAVVVQDDLGDTPR